jgi:hypothetical protein
VRPRLPIGSDFARRQVIYARLDWHLRPGTRFFAAAALTNQILSTLFQAMPGLISAAGHDFLTRLGSALEVINLNWARAMPEGAPGGPSLDELLVRTEQAVAQAYCDDFRARAAESWQSVRREMNALLNGKRRTAICAAAFKHGRDFRRVLAVTRRELATDLDFALEAHRVRIGCALIAEFRGREDLSAQGLPAAPPCSAGASGCASGGGSAQRLLCGNRLADAVICAR